MAVGNHEQLLTESRKPSPMASLRTVMPRLFGHGERAKGNQPIWLFRKLWLWSIVSAVVLVIAGMVAHVQIGNALQVLLEDDLRAMLNTKMSWVDLWYGEQIAAVEAAAQEPFTRVALDQLQAIAAKSPDNAGEALLESTEAAEFRHQLQPVLRAGRFSGYIMTDANGRLLAGSQPRLIGTNAFENLPQEFIQQVQSGEAFVTHPYHSVGPLPDAQGVEKIGRPTMFACAPIVDESGRVVGKLGLRIDPLLEFTKTLNVGRLGETGEAIAYDADGLFLTPCQHEQEMKSNGLLPDLPEATSLLTSHVQLPIASSHKSVSAGFESNNGLSTTGFQNYRNVTVVGAWGWLPNLRIGIVVQLDAEEAHRPLHRLTVTGWFLLSLLATSTVLMIAISIYSERLRQSFDDVAEQLDEFGQYTLEGKISEGAMGTVYHARHALLRRPTAIEILRRNGSHAADNERFAREVQLTSQLSHPNIVTVYDYGRTESGQFFLVLEYLNGRNLKDIVTGTGPMPDGRVIRILAQICAALSCAHANGLLHRDIKPENVMLLNTPGAPDLVKVLDFGLAKPITESTGDIQLTQQNVIVGTPLYMAPEQFLKSDAEVTSDLYSTGATGYFLLTGRPVFEATSLADVIAKHNQNSPVSPRQFRNRPLSSELEAVILQCLAKPPSERPSGAEDLRQRILSCTPTEPWSDEDSQLWWSQPLQPASSSDPQSSTVIALMPPE